MMRKNLCLLLFVVLVNLFPAALWAQPTFVNGVAQTLNACQDGGATDIDPFLSVTDPNVGSTETFTEVLAALPLHGTLSGFPTFVISTGGTVTPSGLTYTPDPGYSGPDAFSIQVSDGTTPSVTAFVVTVNPAPTITLGTSPTINQGTTTANLPYSATTNSPTEYNITWNPAATTAGFGNVTAASLPGSPIPLTVPGAAASNVYTGTLTVENANNCNSIGYSFDVTVVGAPIVTTQAATSITPAAATLNGLVDDNGATTTVTFDYGTNPSLTGSATIAGSPATVTAGAGSSSVTATLSGLTANTTYYFRINGTNSVGTTQDGILSFTTGDNAPSFVNGTPQALSACDNGNPMNIDALLSVNDPDAGQTETFTVLTAPSHGTLNGFGTATVTSTGAIVTPSGLTYTPNAGYTGSDAFTIQVSDGINTDVTTVNITTNALPTITLGTSPTVVQGATTANLPYTATTGTPVNYSITWDPAAVTAGFTDVTTNPITASPIVVTVPAGAAIGTYNGTLVVENSNNCSSSSSAFSVTIINAPTVVTNPATLVMATSATFNGSIDDNGANTDATFSYGTSPLLTGAATVTATPATVLAGAGSTAILYNVTGLTPGTTYYFRATGSNAAGSVNGAILSFTTDNEPTFVNGAPQALTVCENAGATSINADLTINDADAGQTETWSVLTAPSNGTLGGFPATALSTGGNVTPTGLTYTPSAGFSGTDFFTILVSDGNGGAASTTINVTVTPTPNVVLTPANQTLCNNTTASAISFSSSVTATYTWTNSNTSIGLAASGTGTGTPSFTATNTSSVTANATITVTPSNGVCAGSSSVATIAVNPTPSVSPTSDQVRCSGTPTASIIFSGSSVAGTVYNWTNNNTAIGLSASSGSGNIPSFTATDATTTSMSATIVVTPTANGCSGFADSFTIDVNPVPGVATPADQTPCDHSSTAAVNFVGSIPGTTFTWTNSDPSIGLPASGSGDIASFTAMNSSSVAVTATITVTPSTGSCTGTSQFFTITVGPALALTSSTATTTQCDSQFFNYTPTSDISPASFVWSRAAIAGLNSDTASSGTGNINELLFNTTDTIITVTYVYTLTSSSCSDTASLKVNVNPGLFLTGSASASNICDSTIFTYAQASNVVGATFTWSRAFIPGIGNLAANGTGNISETLVNVTTAPITVIYVDTLHYNGCSATHNIPVIVEPRPTLNSTTTPDSICDNTLFHYVATSGTSGTILTWTRGPIAGISNPPASGIDSINEVLSNTTPYPDTVTYVFALTANGCPDTQNVTVTVEPNPVLNVTSTSTICDSTLFSYTLGSNTPGTTFTWTRNVIPGISNPADTGVGNINEVLYNITNAPVLVTYHDVLTANGCSNDQITTVTVNPNPVLSSSLFPTPVCDSAIFAYTPTSDDSGATFTWDRPFVPGIAMLADTGSGPVHEQLINITAADQVVTYYFTTSAYGCAGNAQEVMVTVHPDAALSSSLSDTVCSGAPFVYVPTSLSDSATFAWTRDTVNGISNAQASGIDSIKETLINTTANPVNVVYVYTLSIGSNNVCPSTPQNVTVTVNPSPKAPVLTTEGPDAVCSQTMYQNFGISSPAPATNFYVWSAQHADIYATGSTKQYVLVNFDTVGTAYVYLDYGFIATSCSSQTVYTVSVGSGVSGNPQVIYSESNLLCLDNTVDSYQWGYDDMSTLDSTLLPGETNQFLTGPVFDSTRLYWVITVKNGCMQKSYYILPAPGQHRTITGGTTVQTAAATTDVKIYPNPATEMLNVEVTSAATGDVEVDILNMLGQKLVTTNTINNKAKINVAGLPAGTYLIGFYRDGVKISAARFTKN